MTTLAEKLKSAGVDTIGPRLTTTCIDALRQCPDDMAAAWRIVGERFGYDFLRSLMLDMNPRKAAPKPQAVEQSIDLQPYQPRAIPKERLEKRRELQQIVRSKYKNSGGIAWSDVGWHELAALSRDGKEAVALLSAGPANVPNDGRTVGDVLGVKQTDQIIKSVREAA